MTTPSSCICNEGLQVFFTDNTAYLSLCAINTQTHRKHNWHVCKTTNLWNSVEKFSTMRTVYTRSQEWILCILKSWSTQNWSQDTADMGSEPFLHRSWVMLLEFSWVLCMKHVHFSAHVCLVSSVSTHTHIDSSVPANTILTLRQRLPSTLSSPQPTVWPEIRPAPLIVAGEKTALFGQRHISHKLWVSYVWWKPSSDFHTEISADKKYNLGKSSGKQVNYSKQHRVRHTLQKTLSMSGFPCIQRYRMFTY